MCSAICYLFSMICFTGFKMKFFNLHVHVLAYWLVTCQIVLVIVLIISQFIIIN